jgi:hypothetical protein
MQLPGSLCKRHAVRPGASRRPCPPTACRQTVSGSLSLPSPGFFSPFPHGTRPLSVAREYLALEGGPPCFPRDGSCPVVLGLTDQKDGCAFVYRALTVSGGRFHDPSTRAPLGNFPGSPPVGGPQPRPGSPGRFGLFPVRSPLLGESRLFSSPRGTEMFQFPRFASPPYRFTRRCAGITPRGFPHSGIRGSRPACGSPRLFAACHALPRFLAPRHPPSALSCLTTASGPFRSPTMASADVSAKTLWLLEVSPMRLSKNPHRANRYDPRLRVTCRPWWR